MKNCRLKDIITDDSILGDNNYTFRQGKIADEYLLPFISEWRYLLFIDPD
jgi:hypothetical protein